MNSMRASCLAFMAGVDSCARAKRVNSRLVGSDRIVGFAPPGWQIDVDGSARRSPGQHCAGGIALRVLLVTHYFEPENGAPQRRWAALARCFAAEGHVVEVLAPPPHYPSGSVPVEHRNQRPGSTHVISPGVTVYRLAFLRHAGDIVTRTLDHLVAAFDAYRRGRLLFRGQASPDVVIATAPALESLIAGRALSRRFGIPLVAEMRDAWPDLVAHTPGLALEAGGGSGPKRWVHEFVTKLQIRADAVVTTTTTFARVLRARGIENVQVLRNGTDANRYALVEAGPVQGHRELRVLYMGTIGRSQGLDRVLMAVASLRQAGVEVAARIIGQGADFARLRRMNRRLGYPVEMLDQIDGREVLEQYAWADTMVVSLRDWEPFSWTVPSKLYELLAAGKHVTAIVAGEAAGIVREVSAGDVVQPGDTAGLADLWRRLAEDRSLMRISERGRAWVMEHADYDEIASSYIRLLEQVLHGKASDGGRFL